MSNALQTPQNPVLLTQSAAKQAILARGGEPDIGPEAGIRIGIIGGGCSGLQYLLDFADDPTEDDWVSEQHGIRVFVDQFSAIHLGGTEIDFVDDLSQAGFKFNNPNIQRSCGCGSSFST